MIAVDYKNWKKESSEETLKSFAIEAAVTCDWSEAAKINQKIVDMNSHDVEALNRLARAQACSNTLTKALKTYKKVLALDPYNIIAMKNFDKLSRIQKMGPKPNQNGVKSDSSQNNPLAASTQKMSDIFLFEPGKTKIINLLNLAPPFVLATLSCGDKITFNIKKHSISAVDIQGTYLGAFPDDLAHKLLYLMDGGNSYEIYVKLAGPKSLTVFIREVYRSQKFTNQPSFATGQFSEEKNLLFV